MGYSVGHWDGDAFVVDTRYSNGKSWLDMRGLPATDALHVIERYTRPTIGRIGVAVTIDDPKAYTRPWTVDLSWSLLPDAELIESICEETTRRHTCRRSRSRGPHTRQSSKNCRTSMLSPGMYRSPLTVSLSRSSVDVPPRG